MISQRFLSLFATLVAAGAAAGCTTTDDTAPPQSCADIVDHDPSARDGEYDLYIGGDKAKPWTAYCKDMNRTPSEYLSLVRTSDDYNYASLVARRNVGPAAAAAATYADQTLKTSFTKVRIDPATLEVDIGDLTFSNTNAPASDMVVGATGNTVTVRKMPFGVAASCVVDAPAAGALAPTAASTNIDLSGTAFVVNDTWCAGGTRAKEITPTFSNDDTAVALTAGTNSALPGDCAWAQPTVDECSSPRPFNSAGGKLHLDYVRQR